MNVSSVNSPLTELINWNQSAKAKPPQTTLQSAQQTLAQSPPQILSSFVPTGTSLYGAAAPVDSLIGNISTSAGLNALSQINAKRSAGSQISPFSDTSQALAYGQSAKANVMATLFPGASGSSSNISNLLAAYYPSAYATTSSNTTPGLNVTA